MTEWETLRMMNRARHLKMVGIVCRVGVKGKMYFVTGTGWKIH